MTEKADITGFGNTVGYNVTPHYRLLGSLHVIEIFKKLAAENRGEILLIMIPPSETSVLQDAETWRVVIFPVGTTMHRS